MNPVPSRLHPRSARGGSALALVLTVGALAAPPAAGAAAPAAPEEGRVIVLGFDGADGRTTRERMDAGELPNLARLRDQGTFASLGTTVQAESPVAWASLNTGQNPAKTGVPGFVKRSLDSEGVPMPAPGHTGQATRTLAELDPGPLLGLLARASAPVAAGVAGLATFLVFFVLVAFVLRIGKGVAALVAVLLGGAGAWGAFVARGYVPEEVPGVVTNPLRTQNFWETAAKAGVECVVLDAAMAWDREPVDGARVLGGLGVPDVRGANGDWFVYTTDDFELSRPPRGRESDTGGTVFRVDEVDGRIESALYGPENFWRISRLERELAEVREMLGDSTRGFRESNELRDREDDLEREIADLRETPLSVPIVIEKQDGAARVTIDGHAQTIAEGAWSDWYRVSFALNPLVQAKAVTRVKVVTLDEPCFRMYVDVLHIDPQAPPFWQPVSQPAGFSAELADWIGGPYETVGWACMTMSYKDEEVDPETFLQDIEFTLGWREAMTFAALDRDDWRVLFSVFSTPDRVQHMMYQFLDPEHPLYDAAKASQKVTFFGEEIELRDAIPAIYRQIDRIVGRVMDEHMRPEDTLLLCADHGFQSFRRGVNVNNWLAENGFLVLRDGVSKSQNRVLAFADMSRTRAYSMGLGMIWVNLQGREKEGIVPPSEKRAVLEELRAKLLESVDPATGETFTSAVAILEDIHDGPYLDEEPDLMPGFRPGYRVSWRTTLGGIHLVDDTETGAAISGDVFEDNDKTWSGDHISVDPEEVRGIFFCNRRVAVPEEGGVDLLHVAPTVLALCGVALPPELDVAPLEVLP